MDQKTFSTSLNKIYDEIKSGKYQNDNRSAEEISSELVVKHGLRERQQPLPNDSRYTKLFEPSFMAEYQFSRRGIRKPTYAELTDPQKRTYYNNYALNKYMNPNQKVLSPEEAVKQTQVEERQNWETYLAEMDSDDRVELTEEIAQKTQKDLSETLRASVARPGLALVDGRPQMQYNQAGSNIAAAETRNINAQNDLEAALSARYFVFVAVYFKIAVFCRQMRF